jgi:PIN domain nuclease of toxin-antitoxin system
LILDTTYILPVAKVDIDTDLLTLIDEGRIKLSIDDVKISLISIFELQARCAKYKLPSKFVIDAVEIINSALKIEPFYNPKIIELADLLSWELSDYIDCLILATAIVLKEDLVTEDSRIRTRKSMIKERYKINVLSYNDLAQG